MLHRQQEERLFRTYAIDVLMAGLHVEGQRFIDLLDGPAGDFDPEQVAESIAARLGA